jgi:hypothetical protein
LSGIRIASQVSVKGREGVAATVVVTTYPGYVWMSIVPPFTWEAIMDPGHVDQLIHALGLAREESNRRVPVGGTKVGSGSNGVVREVEGGSVAQGREIVGGEDT